eukprot:TRINITY_DN176_c0_g1_i1.p1 TRINITY_DN176_c0_g1~~TRINITY_DN176_c0_g1_i1.p1  ORF type:complete len:311 (-),score=57.00 TRINITY_DN176_c0_g1_i1:33-965(-)
MKFKHFLFIFLSTSLAASQLANCDIQNPLLDARCCTPFGQALQDGTPCGFYYQCQSGSCEYLGKQGKLSKNCDLLNPDRDSECCYLGSEIMDETDCKTNSECKSGVCKQRDEPESTVTPSKPFNPCDPNDPLRDARCCTPSGSIFQDGSQCGNSHQCKSGFCEWTGLTSTPSKSCNVSSLERDSNCCYYSAELKNGTRCGEASYCFAGVCKNSTESLNEVSIPSINLTVSTQLPIEGPNVSRRDIQCSSENKICEDQRIGKVCFDPQNYECVVDSYNRKSRVCHKPDGSCSGLCFDWDTHKCKEGKLMSK